MYTESVANEFAQINRLKHPHDSTAALSTILLDAGVRPAFECLDRATLRKVWPRAVRGFQRGCLFRERISAPRLHGILRRREPERKRRDEWVLETVFGTRPLFGVPQGLLLQRQQRGLQV